MMIFSLDAETDGLYGPAFAIGVSVREDGVETACFVGRCPYGGDNEWVQTNVIPALAEMPVAHESSEELEEAFWQFWLENRERAIPIAHCHSPVETGLLRRCVERDLSARQWSGPYPAIHDVATLLLLLGESPDSVDAYVAKHRIEVPEGAAHDPYYDAVIAALVWEHAAARLTTE